MSKKRSAPGVAAIFIIGCETDATPIANKCKNTQASGNNATVYTPAEKIKPITSPFQDEQYNTALCINSS